MAADKARAIVIRAVPFGETSAVVTLFTREFGKLRALAKGAWRPKGGFDAALDLLSSCQVLVLRKTSGGLDLLTEACLESRFRVATSLAAFHGGMYVAELLDALTADADPQGELFDAASHTLHRLSGHAGPDAVVWPCIARFELAALRAAGQAPALSRCAACRAALPTAQRVAFGMLDGGVLCGHCRQGRRAVVSVSSGTLAALQRLVGPTRNEPEHPLPDAVSGELRAVMNTYLAHILGKRPRLAQRILPSAPRSSP
ncbi:MAG: DNA repair protein RecO [Planctomycetota bacterium]|nr:MAG: DNA repair protein RecO [Planctomycetota bacterium]